MKKYIVSNANGKRGSYVYTIERQDWKISFRTPENYFSHASRSVWFDLSANVFVQYKGAFYMVETSIGDSYDPFAILEFVEVSAEEAAEIMTQRAAKDMSEANEAMNNAIAAAIDYDADAAASHAANAETAASDAAFCANCAAEHAAAAGTSEAASIAETAAEYAAHARRDADRATETAEANAHELESAAANRAEAAAISYADRADETTDAAEAAAFADRARHAADDAAEAASSAEDAAACARQAAERAIRRAEELEELEEEPEAGAIYERYELEAFIGTEFVDGYDLEAIEQEATAYDPATGHRVWTAFDDDLAAICQRHEL